MKRLLSILIFLAIHHVMYGQATNAGILYVGTMANPIALVAFTTTTGTLSTATTNAINTTGANTIFIATSVDNGSLGTISDNKGNSYVIDKTIAGGSGSQAVLYRSSSSTPIVGTGHTFTITGAIGSFISVAAFSGLAASPLDQSASASPAAGTSGSPGSVTPTQNNELFITVISAYTSITAPAVTPGTIIGSTAYVPAIAYAGGLAYLIQNTAAAINFTWSWTGVISSAMVVTTNK
jgi:hypothetical protein